MREYKSLLRITMLPIIVLVFVQCTATTRIITSTQCAGASNTVRDTTVIHFFWGLQQASDIKPGCDTRFNHLNKVEIKTKFGQMLVGVLTLGIVIPQTVTWCCAPYNPTPGVLGESR